MASYAIGDVQGCFTELRRLLDKIDYQPQQDQLWFSGDLVNRGPESLATLRFIHDHCPNTVAVLGNHDLHLLAIAHGASQLSRKDTLAEILDAPDSERLLTWLRNRPLLHVDANLGYILVHAGLYPLWTLEQTIAYAKELESVLQGDQFIEFLQHMYGNHPHTWREDLNGWDRLRFMLNSFTRMRYCSPAGQLELKNKGPAEQQNSPFVPWFDLMPNELSSWNIIFGHWASLKGKTSHSNLFAIDTGCVWGGHLTALRLEDQQVFAVESDQKKIF